MSLEVRQVRMQGFAYFLSFWNDLDITSFALNITFIACDLAHVDPLKTRCVGSCAVFLMWIKFFYFLRLFQPTSALVRMIIEICHDMATFSLVLTIAMIGFGNVFYILCVNTVDRIGRNWDADPANAGNPY